MTPLASVDIGTALGIGGLVSALVMAFVAVKKMGPERDAIFITSAQGAAVIQDNLIAMLQKEVDRRDARIRQLEADVARLESENERLESANVTLTRRHGVRHEDSDGK